MEILIKNGRVIDPANKIDKVSDIYICNGKIAAIEKNHLVSTGNIKVIDAGGKWVTPGLIDLHVHLRDPGLTYKEDIATGSLSAAKGGFTTICAMPNTNPVMDSPELIIQTYNRIKKEAVIDVLLIGSATKGQKGTETADISGMANAGICAVSEDGYSVLNPMLMKKALKACVEANIPFFDHCEDISLVNGGVINEGIASQKYNLPGISCDSEDIICARDIILADSAKARLHLCHVSTEGSVGLVEYALGKGVNITAECCPHHFTLSDEDIESNDGNYKMNPPLRSVTDVAAIRKALSNGLISVIATDHAPHSASEKEGGFLKALNGIVGLETALPLCITGLVRTGILKPAELIEKLTVNPAKILGIDKGHLNIGSSADITIIDTEKEYEINVDGFMSKGRNTPFNGKKVYGLAETVIKSGKIIVENGNLINA